jgi:hypothetical protein
MDYAGRINSGNGKIRTLAERFLRLKSTGTRVAGKFGKTRLLSGYHTIIRMIVSLDLII